jgi:hypothetical protein
MASTQQETNQDICKKAIFDAATPPYQEALAKRGYKDTTQKHPNQKEKQ